MLKNSHTNTFFVWKKRSNKTHSLHGLFKGSKGGRSDFKLEMPKKRNENKNMQCKKYPAVAAADDGDDQ